MTPLTVILNPKARSLSRSRITTASIESMVGSHGQVCPTHSLAELDTVVRQVLTYGPQSTVAFVGGDGTLCRGISALLAQQSDASALPQLLLCPAGTFNYIARNLGHSGPPLALLQRYLAGTLHQTLQQRTLDVRCGDIQQYGFFFSWGVGYRMLRRFYAQGHKPSPAVALRVVAQGLMQSSNPLDRDLFRKRCCALSIDDAAVERRAIYSLVVGSVDSVSLGFRPFATPVESPQLKLTAHGMPRYQLLRHLPKLIYRTWGRAQLHMPGLLDAEVHDRVHCHIDEGFTVDGEVFDLTGEQPLQLQPGPVLRFWSAKASPTCH